MAETKTEETKPKRKRNSTPKKKDTTVNISISRNWLFLLVFLLGFGCGMGSLALYQSLQSESGSIINADTIETKTAREVADIPFQERTAVADKLRLIAKQLSDSEIDKYSADERIRESIASQSSAKEWSKAMDTISEYMDTTKPDTLQKVAKGMERNK